MLPIQKGFIALAGALLWLCWMSLRNRGHSELRARVLEVVSAAARRGLPLAPAIERMAPAARGVSQNALRQLGAQLRSGTPVWQALEQSLPRRTLPGYVLDTLRSVEGSPGLRPALASLAATKERTLRVRDRLSLALAYPSLLAVMLVGLFVTTETLLHRDAIAAEYGSASAAASGGAWSAAQGGALLLCGALTIALLSYLAGSRGRLRTLLDDAGRRLPWARRLGHEAATGRMLRIAAQLTRARLPLGAMLRRAAPASGLGWLERDVLHAAESADAGAPAEQVWHATGIPQHAAVRLALCTHASPAAFAERMLAAADACDRRVERAVDRVLAAVQPAALLFFGTLIAIHFANVFARLDAARLAAGGLPW